jgi:hypothetical protein
MLPKLNTRTLVLGVLALSLVGVTAYDYTVGIGRRADSSAVEEAAPVRHDAPRSRVSELVRETAELKHFLAHAPEVRARYQAIAVPYAEAVATFGTLYAPGESPQAVARKRLSGLLPAPVDVSGLLVSEVNPSDRGAVWLTATLSFGSNDSAAFETAVLKLGDPANGTLWKELSIASDVEARTLRASGKLLLLMVEQSE